MEVVVVVDAPAVGSRVVPGVVAGTLLGPVVVVAVVGRLAAAAASSVLPAVDSPVVVVVVGDGSVRQGTVVGVRRHFLGVAMFVVVVVGRTAAVGVSWYYWVAQIPAPAVVGVVDLQWLGHAAAADWCGWVAPPVVVVVLDVVAVANHYLLPRLLTTVGAPEVALPLSEPFEGLASRLGVWWKRIGPRLAARVPLG